jgi:hypothetical protein
MNIALYNLKRNLTKSNIYIINSINIYANTFKLLSNKCKLIIIFNYLLFCKNGTILLFIACENLHLLCNYTRIIKSLHLYGLFLI